MSVESESVVILLILQIGNLCLLSFFPGQAGRSVIKFIVFLKEPVIGFIDILYSF